MIDTRRVAGAVVAAFVPSHAACDKRPPISDEGETRCGAKCLSHCQDGGDCADDDDKQNFCGYACTDRCVTDMCGVKREPPFTACEDACKPKMERSLVDYSQCMEACDKPPARA